MKKFSFAFLALLLFTFNSTSQEVGLSEKDELIKLKKELINNINRGNEDHNIYGVTSTTGLKSVQDDYGDPPDWDWITTFGGSGKDIARKIAVASDGSLFVTGSFSGEISLGSNNYSSVGRRDAFLAKFQNDGSLIWFNQFSPSPGERIDAYGIHLDVSENVYFTGYFSGDVNFGDFNLPGTHGKNLFLVSANPDGEITMATAHATTNPEELGLKVDTDNDGNIFVLGSTDGTTYWRHPSVIIKYASDGTVILDYYHDQNFCDMKIMNDNIYFAGTIIAPDYIGDFYLEPMGYNDAFVAKSNTNMVFTWAEMGGHTSSFNGDSYGIAMYISPDEDIFLLGQFRNNVIWGTFELEGVGGFITKCSADGDFLWAKETMDYYSDTPTDITGNDENIFVSTYFNNLNSHVFINEIKAFDATSGVPGLVVNSEDKIESVSYSTIDNSLVLTQSADEQIRISMLDDNSLNSEWSLLFGGNSASAYGIGMDVDQYGFLYNFGYASNQIDYFGQTINKGLFLTKQGDTGIPVWVVQFPDADYISNTIGNYIVVDTNTNNVYITGTFYNPLVIPGGPTLIPDILGSIYILKYDFNGNYQWAVQEDFNGRNLCLTSANSGNVLLSGLFENSITIGNTELVSAGYQDVFIIEYNSSGEHVWAKRAGGEDIEYVGLISTDGQDNVYLTGEFTSHDVTVDDYAITLEEGDGNILFAKFDPQGNVQWVTVKGGSSVTWGDYYGWPTGIHTDFEGYSYIKGWHADSASFDNIMLTSLFNKPGYNNKWNKFVAKFDPDGNTIWAKSINELAFSYGYNQFDVDQTGNVYSGFRVRDTTLFGDDFMYVNTGKYDLLVVNYSDDGELNWIKSIEDSESGSTWISTIACYDEETAFVCGWFNDYLDFGTTSFEANNKNGFIGVLGEITGITVYQRDDETLLFDLFPNPAHQEVSILLNDELVDQADLTITNITGIELFFLRLTKGQAKITIDLSEFSPGIYFAKLQSGKMVAVRKFVVD